MLKIFFMNFIFYSTIILFLEFFFSNLFCENFGFQGNFFQKCFLPKIFFTENFFTQSYRDLKQFEKIILTFSIMASSSGIFDSCALIVCEKKQYVLPGIKSAAWTCLTPKMTLASLMSSVTTAPAFKYD